MVTTLDDRLAWRGFGYYLHLPFCSRRCDYCAFATWTGREEQMAAYVVALLGEIDLARREGLVRPAATIFLGGGTPSLLGAPLLLPLLEALGAEDALEVTVECNPESTDTALLRELRSGGVNRISLGVQSLSPKVLTALGRSHDPDEARRAFAAVAEAGFENFNVDLIYGAAGESAAQWAATLEELCSLQAPPPHVSAYALSVEAGTPLSRDPRRHPDDDLQAERYHEADHRLAAAGLHWYEISNFSRPGYECLHNLNYWNEGDYLGFGVAAHSHLDGRRFRNVASLDRYLERRSQGRSVVAASEHLDDDGRALEALELALRTRRGVPRAALDAAPELDGLYREVGGRVVLTLEGRLLANELSIRLRLPTPR